MCSGSACERAWVHLRVLFGSFDESSPRVLLIFCDLSCFSRRVCCVFCLLFLWRCLFLFVFLFPGACRCPCSCSSSRCSTVRGEGGLSSPFVSVDGGPETFRRQNPNESPLCQLYLCRYSIKKLLLCVESCVVRGMCLLLVSCVSFPSRCLFVSLGHGFRSCSWSSCSWLLLRVDGARRSPPIVHFHGRGQLRT